MKKFIFFSLVAVVLAITLLGEAVISEAATCNPIQLSACAGAITGGGSPSRSCCSKLRAQRPCLCRYYRDPRLRRYVRSPGARKVAGACQVHVRC
uniref:Non-specific lipid-transfer protein type 2 n=1 Tax=Tamarix hispida TaxID=189793 RepID=C0KHL1_9CARY|nr:non-specific lipid-transfer protein type 2 [Tamarix hispida]